MTPQKKTPSQQMALLAFCASVLGAIAFFLPMFSFLSVEFNGLDLIDKMGDDNIGIIIGLVGAGVAVIFALMGMSNRKMLSTAAVGAVVAVCGVLYSFIDQEMMDYAGIGFWLFVIGEGACFALSLISMNKAKAE